MELLWCLQTGNLDQVELALTEVGSAPSGITLAQQQIRGLWETHAATSMGEKRAIIRSRQRVQYGAVHLRVPSEYIALFTYLVAADLNAAVASVREALSNDCSAEVSPATG